MSEINLGHAVMLSTVQQHIEKKGQFRLSGMDLGMGDGEGELSVMQHYHLLPDTIYPGRHDGGTQMVLGESLAGRRDMTIRRRRGFPTQCGYLRVMDFKNKPIKPTPMPLTSTQNSMRCLAEECLAMFGLGHYICCVVKSMPQEPKVEESKEMVQAGAQINACLEKDDYYGAAECWAEFEYAEVQVIARAPSKGGQVSTANRAKLKSTEFRMALNEAKGIDMSGVQQ